MATKSDNPRKLDASGGSRLSVYLKEEDWKRLDALRALKTNDATEPSDADVIRWALKEAHCAHIDGSAQ